MEKGQWVSLDVVNGRLVNGKSQDLLQARALNRMRVAYDTAILAEDAEYRHMLRENTFDGEVVKREQMRRLFDYAKQGR